MGRSKRSKNKIKNMRNVDKRSEGYKTRAQLKKEKKQLKRQSQMEQKFLIGLYDNYRKNGLLHSVLENSKLIGSYSTQPNYTMYETKDSTNCVVKNNGDDSIKIEVWEVNQLTLNKIEDSYDYSSNYDDSLQEYNFHHIKSPFGEIIIYLYNDEIKENQRIISGDWIEHCIYKKAFGDKIKKLVL